MAFFWKKHTEPVPVVALPSDEEQTAKAEAAPQPAVQPPRQQPRAMRMSAEELQQVTEQRRLAQTALDAVQQQIDELADSVRRHNEYVSLAARHEEASADLYGKNKTMSSLRAAEQRLARFEACEEAMPLYLRLCMAEEQQAQYRQQLSVVKEQERQLRSVADATLSQFDAMRSAANEARNQLDLQEEALETGYRIDGQRQAMENEKNATLELKNSYSDLRQHHTAIRDDLRQQLDSLQQQLYHTRTQFTPLNSNRTLMESVDGVLVMLDNMHALLRQRESLDQEAKRMAVRQRDMSDRLQSLTQRDQRLEERLSTMQNEIAIHRSQNHGIDGQALQLRVMNLRAKRQELNAAMRLWAHICTLWNDIDQNRLKLRQLQQGAEKSNADIERMELNVRTLKAEARQRRYDYTVSKGQNVIKLRNDLHEGVACPVCGATTHPFHCDTIPEQNHLIAEWKSEAERLELELQNAENALLSEQIANATRVGTMNATADSIDKQQALLQLLTTQWAEYEHLDAALRGGSPATNANERMQTLRGLLETTQRDETASTEQLNTYNYHQQQINRLALEVDNIENERTELSASLNQTNTSTQVMTAQTEWLQQQIADVDTAYQHLYQQLEQLIDLTDWHGKWMQSHDNFKLQLKTRASEWQRLLNTIQQQELQVQHIQKCIELCDAVILEYDNVMLSLDQRMNAIAEQERSILNQYARLFSSSNAHDSYRRAHDNLMQAQQRLDDHLSLTIKALTEADKMRGTTDVWEQTVMSISDTASEARSSLDDWLYRFRIAGNPPCRLDELQQLFDPANDWNAQRSQIRQARSEYDLAKAVEAEIRTKMLSVEQGDSPQQAASRRESLMRQRMKLLNTIAALDQRLTTHQLLG